MAEPPYYQMADEAVKHAVAFFARAGVVPSRQLVRVLSSCGMVVALQSPSSEGKLDVRLLVLTMAACVLGNYGQIVPLDVAVSPLVTRFCRKVAEGARKNGQYLASTTKSITDDTAAFPINARFGFDPEVETLLAAAADQAKRQGLTPERVELDHVVRAIAVIGRSGAGAAFLSKIGLEAGQFSFQDAAGDPRDPHSTSDRSISGLIATARARSGVIRPSAMLETDPRWPAVLNAATTPERAYQAFATSALELTFEAVNRSPLLPSFGPRGTARALFAPGDAQLAMPTLVILSGDQPEPLIVELSEYLDQGKLLEAAKELTLQSGHLTTEPALAALLADGPAGLLRTYALLQPAVVTMRQPKMVRMCCPSPSIEIGTCDQRSTAGAFCRDAKGQLGITACFHGTGKKRTIVHVDGHRRTVTAANEIQDIVFIALDEGYNYPELRGLKGLSSRGPRIPDVATFEGSTSGLTETRIMSADRGLLRLQSNIQLRIQTEANTEYGDSGAALVDQDGFVLGFAFQRTGINEVPEFTDWIWAPNAMASLCLLPVQ